MKRSRLPASLCVVVCWPLMAIAQAPQNPSPMVEHTRSHDRLEPSEPAGERYKMPVGELFVPESLAAEQRMPLVVHFHGDPWVVEVSADRWGRGAAVSVQLGSGSSAYAKPFAEDEVLLANLLNAASEKSAKKFDPVMLSGWSAGYGAIREIIRTEQNQKNVDAVVLLDGLHTGYASGRPGPEESELEERPLEPFIRFARQAAGGKKAMLVTHSTVFPGTFASTTETTDYLLRKLEIERLAVLKWGPVGMQQLSQGREGHLVVMGYAGNSAPDHVDHLHAATFFWEQVWRLSADEAGE